MSLLFVGMSAHAVKRSVSVIHIDPDSQSLKYYAEISPKGYARLIFPSKGKEQPSTSREEQPDKIYSILPARKFERSKNYMLSREKSFRAKLYEKNRQVCLITLCPVMI